MPIRIESIKEVRKYTKWSIKLDPATDIGEVVNTLDQYLLEQNILHPTDIPTSRQYLIKNSDRNYRYWLSNRQRYVDLLLIEGRPPHNNPSLFLETQHDQALQELTQIATDLKNYLISR